MRFRVDCRRFAAILLAIVGLGLIAPAARSDWRFRLASESTTAVAELLERGTRLETERRWDEALSLYEQAIRQFPTESHFEHRFEFARIHYELSRRYNDASFRESVRTMSLDQSLGLYSEVLLKIQSHYVELPDWKRLVTRGVGSLEVALQDKVFLDRQLPGVASASCERFARDARQRLSQERVDSRQSARDAVERAARRAQAELGLSATAVVLEFTCGATGALDAYSTFLTADQLNEVYAQIEGNFVGLGVELRSAESGLLIDKVIQGSPAEAAGLLAGDQIIAVGDQATQELSTDAAAGLLQGPEGSTVEITALTPSQPPRRLKILRQHVEVPSIENSRMLADAPGVAYLKLTSFQKKTSRDLDAALWKLHRAGMKSLVIDLRGNPGGLLTTSVEAVDRFVDKGVIVSTRGRGPQEDYNYSAHSQGTWRVPLVVLIDGDSASASEIFAGAIRDHHRGTIVGARSYGKGSVQGIFPLNLANSGLRLTTAKFYSPSGRPYSKVGVEPDLVVEAVARPIGATGEPPTSARDAALDAAVKVAQGQLARR
jgi:carboxyl-terminal processing protease